jgi:hypothetical protein
VRGRRRIEVAWVLPLAVVVPMLALASLLGTPEIIFPEGAALVMGIWSLGLPGWSTSRWRVAALPPVFAAAGVLLLRVDLSQTTAILIAITLALIALQLLDTRLAPSMSAAVLPIVFDVRAWSYPLAVLAISLVVAAGMSAFPRERARRDPPRTGRYAAGAVAGAWLVIVTWILVGEELLALSAATFAPPLFVSALEWIGRGPLEPQVGLRRWALLVGAALSGSVAAQVVPVAWIAGAVAVVATLVVMRLLVAPHPPALAIALIPQILPGAGAKPLSYTLAIAAGGAALYVGVYGVGVAARQPRRARAPLPERA